MTTNATAGRVGAAAGRAPRTYLELIVNQTDPTACRWCSTTKREHMQRWAKAVGWHQWTQPTQQQIKDRMHARRTAGGTR